MTTRLRSTVLRIMGQHDKFKEEIQRIQASKPVSRPSNGTHEGKFTKDFKSFFSKDKSAITTVNIANGTGSGAILCLTHISFLDIWCRYIAQQSFGVAWLITGC